MPSIHFPISKISCSTARILSLLCALHFTPVEGQTNAAPAAAGRPSPEDCPWGITSSATSISTCSEWLPKAADAGIRWARMFPEWSSFEAIKGTFDFSRGDAIVDAAKASNIEISGLIFGKAPWTNAGAHAFPMANLDDWSQYGTALAEHYKGRIGYWEIWNEGNAAFNDGHNGTGDYARLLTAAYDGIKKGNPDALVGMSVASFDPAYMDQVMIDQGQDGKAGSFDYLCIHPYETFGGIGDVDGEVPYLWMSHLLRDALKADAPPAKVNVPIWITEIGRPLDRSTNEVGIPLGQDVHEVDAAKAVVKSYIMAVAQGIARICWFEARDPVGEPPGYGLLKGDNTPRPSYVAMQTMTRELGETPKYQGWLNLGPGKRSYGFVFQNGATSVLALWMPSRMTESISFDSDIKVVDSVTGEVKTKKANEPLTVTDQPAYITGLSADLVAQAQAHAAMNFPWGGDYSKADTVSLELGPHSKSTGVICQAGHLAKPHTFADGTTGYEVLGQIGSTLNFYTHPSFANIKTREYYIRISFRRLESGNVGMNFSYEVADSQGKGPLRYNGGWYSLGPDLDWQTQTWHVTDACFAKMWGFDFCIKPEQSVPFVVGKVEVSTKPFTN